MMVSDAYFLKLSESYAARDLDDPSYKFTVFFKSDSLVNQSDKISSPQPNGAKNCYEFVVWRFCFVMSARRH